MAAPATQSLRDAIDRLPRAGLAHLPTPLDLCRGLSETLGGPTLWIKRDDCTGLAFGGNKSRQHEFVLGDAVARGVDTVIQGAASQSNQSRQLAAAAAKLGLRCVLMPRKDGFFGEAQGNMLVSRQFGACIAPVEPDVPLMEAKNAMAARLQAAGRTPCVLGMGSEETLAIAAIAYVEVILEILDQLAAAGKAPPSHIYVTSQGSTQAGLQLGCKLLGLGTYIRGINPMDARNEAYVPPEGIARQVETAARRLGFNVSCAREEIDNTIGWVGPEYGVPSRAGQEAFSLLARTDGILTDPVYSAKGLAALLADIRAGRLTATDRVVFVHTGGLPAIFSYAHALGEESRTP